MPIVAGDTKVVEHGKADGMYISTTGIGVVDPRASSTRVGSARRRCSCRARSAIMAWPSCWPAPNWTSKPICVSDTRLVWPLVEALIDAWRRREMDARSHPRRRRNVAERAVRTRPCGDRARRRGVPVDDVVRGACELLGLDPLQVANEGQFVAIVAPEHADAAHWRPAGDAGRRAAHPSSAKCAPNRRAG